MRHLFRAAHQQSHYGEMPDVHSEPHKKTSSDYLKAIVFGGLDGEPPLGPGCTTLPIPLYMVNREQGNTSGELKMGTRFSPMSTLLQAL